MAKKKDNRWNDVDGGRAFIIPYTLLRHQNFISLSPYALKLLMDLSRQCSGRNGGYQCAAWSLMREAGWRSPTTLDKAIEELLHYGMIEQTRQGGRNRANLYALTWMRIDEKPRDDLDRLPTLHPSNKWKREVEPFRRTSGKRRVAKVKRNSMRQPDGELSSPPGVSPYPSPCISSDECTPPRV